MRATCCAQQCYDMLRSNVAIVWSELANVEPAMLGYVALRCCYRLAGALEIRKGVYFLVFFLNFFPFAVVWSGNLDFVFLL